jgi:hypothetical protein
VSAASPTGRAHRATLWTLTGLLLALEAAVVALALMPRVEPDYRAYYIDAETDCWPRASTGDYTLGSEISFLREQADEAAAIKVCGWFYPDADDGTWSHGAYSRLRFRFPPVATPLSLAITAGAMVNAAHPRQRVDVSIDGTAIGTIEFSTRDAETRSIAIPDAVAAKSGEGLEVRFDYPDARPGTEMGANEDPRPRAIRLEAVAIETAE